jgi:hypothetical protein
MEDEDKYIGIDDKGNSYVARAIDWTNMTALCQAEEWIGWLRCRFEKFEKID